jgi:ribosomal protein S18 acetylase RimI-like enzyme
MSPKYDKMVKDKFNFRIAETSEINEIHKILVKSFYPYRKDYTEDAFNATVLTPSEIKRRIKEDLFKVYVAIADNRIVGTGSIVPKEDSYYLRSMAVIPDFQRHGIGTFILDNICSKAQQNCVNKITLETSKALNNAIRFYKKYGFKSSGRMRDFYGIKIFEMIKKLE